MKKLRVGSCELRVVVSGLLVLISTSLVLNGAEVASADVRGAYPILTTPYLADGSVDYDSLVKEAEWTRA